MATKAQSDSMIKRAKVRLMMVVAIGLVTMAAMVLVSLAFGHGCEVSQPQRWGGPRIDGQFRPWVD